MSDCYDFREAMSMVINKLFHPLINVQGRLGLRQWRNQVTNTLRFPQNHVIDVNILEHVDANVKRLELLDRLSIVRLFVLRGTEDQETFITIGGQQILQNRYVYDKVVSRIPADRIFVLPRDCEGLSIQPPDYRMLETFVDPPYFKSFTTFERLPEGTTFCNR